MPYALDIPGLSAWQNIRDQPYPAKPEGLAVPEWIFQASLSAWTPITVAAVYLVATHATNSRFGANKPKPADLIKNSYGLSQAVLGHNILLAVYSAWTFVNVAARLGSYFGRSVLSGGAEGLVNAYCTVPIHDASRSGLGFYVWLFYISKYYEIVDSVILILKGKPVSNLQSYHHAGAMACMWAAYRYSASAVFLFLSFNSLVHSLMYTYYSMTALKLPFTGGLKRSMTTIQITQLVVGVQLAAAYLFIRYNPLAYPQGALPSPGRVLVTATEHDLASKAPASLGTSAFDGTSYNATALAAALSSSTGIASNTKEAAAVILRSLTQSAGADNKVSCVATSGQAFAVALNVTYLLPLIYLFVSFYIRSYKKKAAHAAAAKAAKAQ
ncbi:uncharacterized protein PFL1_00232 [Pseudozyma flocculosa PF-1]|uniref:Elongation of fatty acids protein n=1 Tax=Pseudozyma flocculosa TaxID=84751 RepID=A0A5C3ET69_9BASI|nr:uncharacterized protein PFL1_00232 [Pseudozyma flocculosa PF-1]EPQ32034.1 hypothetical protein PFL1_00232 [Pseudozyma flocculosa PF-1]SPO35040.1 related to SUR4 - elongase, involved in fatty acid and sphingolipid biosynthesis [Pseudozyma flocculosa]